jgi:hypothetical protein
VRGTGVLGISLLERFRGVGRWLTTQLEIRIEGNAVSLRRLDQVVTASNGKSLRGLLQGTTALEDHLREHEEETKR